MEKSLYSAEWVESYYDEFAGQEWDRLVRTPAREIQLAVHANALTTFTREGDRVLEVGAGPGRFTQILAQLGATIVVTDISQVQLDLNRENATTYGFAGHVAEWRKLDICDLSFYASESFDSVVAFGGPLSYVFDRRDQAIEECKRVTKPGGFIALGVMSLWGTVHQYLEGVLGYTPEENARIIATGDLTSENAKFASHFCHLFHSGELKQFLENHDLEVTFVSASSGLSAVHASVLDAVRTDELKWKQLVAMEIQACQTTGYLDAGTHLIAVGHKPS